MLDDSLTYVADTKVVINGLDLSDVPLVQEAGFTESVYLGILANTKEPDRCKDYLTYLFLNETDS